MDKSPNTEQLRAIRTTEGPVLILAGPGSGKTYTLIQRTLHLIRDKGVRPEQILITTFTEKAARELVSRLTSELKNADISADLSQMYIGTFHSIFYRIIREKFPDKKYTLMDDFEQKYFLFRNLESFPENLYVGKIFDPIKVRGKKEYKKHPIEIASALASLVNKLHEDGIEKEELNDFPQSMEILAIYEDMLNDNDLLDFSYLQKVFYDLMRENPEILDEINSQIQYIMIDEFQDTNLIQNNIIGLFKTANLCVVGDDDQSIYRFRGSSVKNILDFTRKYPEAVNISLDTNYRSHKKIIDFYKDFMDAPNGYSLTGIADFKWENAQGKFRYPKDLKAGRSEDSYKGPGVLKLSIKPIPKKQDPLKRSIEKQKEDFYERIASAIDVLMETGTVKDENQIVFLSNSLKYGLPAELMRYLSKREKKRYNVYSPRSNSFFQRKAIKGILGFLLRVFPEAESKLKEWLNKSKFYGYGSFITNLKKASDKILDESGLEQFSDKSDFETLRQYFLKDCNNFLEIFYQFLTLPYFETRLERDLTLDPLNQISIRDLAQFSRFLAKYDEVHKVSHLDAQVVLEFFQDYVLSLNESGQGEYEEVSVMAPSGSLSFMTIHQAKGLEFPVVIVLPDDDPKFEKDLLEDEKQKIERALRPKESADDLWKIWHDYFRLYYVAFSRAKDLLIIPYFIYESEKKGSITSELFEKVTENVDEIETTDVLQEDLIIQETSKVNIKPIYSFTSHVSVYDECPSYYKFYKELGFARSQNTHNTDVGSLVHETIEKIHKTVLDRGAERIDRDYFDPFIKALVRETQAELEPEMLFSKNDINKAIQHVKNYVSNQQQHWNRVQEAEIELITDRKNYFLKGKIDLIENDDGALEIVDFKTGKKPDLRRIRDNRQLQHYKQQMEIYHHLLSENEEYKQKGYSIKGASLYYTDDPEDPRLQILDESQIKRATKIDETLKNFDRAVEHIETRSYRHCSPRTTRCDSCDFLHHCHGSKSK